VKSYSSKINRNQVRVKTEKRRRRNRNDSFAEKISESESSPYSKGKPIREASVKGDSRNNNIVNSSIPNFNTVAS
jgi:hypothetical protein